MFDVVLLLAQQKAAAPNGSATAIAQFLPFIVIALMGYMIILRPQMRQEKQRRSMLSAVKKNDRVLTAGGIYGTVSSIDAGSEKVVLRVDDDRGVKITVTKTSIVRVLTADDKEAEPGKLAAPVATDAR